MKFLPIVAEEILI